MDTQRAAGWLKASADRLRRTPAEMAVRHVIAQSSKQFFGFGPKGRSQAVVQGDLVVFRTDLTGPRLLDALRESPFGRLIMRQIGDLYRVHMRAELAGFAADHFGVRVLAALHDVDFSGGYTIGVALLDGAGAGAPPPPRPSHREALLAGWRAARAALGLPAEPGADEEAPGARGTPPLVSLRARPLPLPPGAPGPQAVCARLEAWARARDAFADALWAAWPGGRPAGATAFLAQDEERLIGGAVFDAEAGTGIS